MRARQEHRKSVRTRTQATQTPIVLPVLCAKVSSRDGVAGAMLSNIFVALGFGTLTPEPCGYPYL